MSIHSDAAQARVEEIRALREQIPNLVIPASRTERRKLSKAASVPPELVELAAVAVKNSPSLVRGGAINPDQVRPDLFPKLPFSRAAKSPDREAEQEEQKGHDSHNFQ